MICLNIIVINCTNCYGVNPLLLFVLDADGLWLSKGLNKLYMLSAILIVSHINIFINIIWILRFHFFSLILIINRGIKNNIWNYNVGFTTNRIKGSFSIEGINKRSLRVNNKGIGKGF